MLMWNDIERFATNGSPPPDRRDERTPEEWRAALAPDVFDVARRAGTERPFSSPMCTKFEPGRYACACCGSLLFDAETKYDSRSGWPSFTQPIAENAITYHMDRSHGMVRVETTCAVCDAHLGHVFPDGPPPSRLRYCMNGLSLTRVDTEA